MRLGDKLNQFYTFILNKENRALNYYKLITNAAYNAITNLNMTFDIVELDKNGDFYEKELMLIKNVLSKYDLSKILRNYYQNTVFRQIIPDNLNWLVVKCDKIEVDLNADNINETNYKFHFCYNMRPFDTIYHLHLPLLQRYCNQRRDISLYFLSKKYVDSEFNNFSFLSILIYILTQLLFRSLHSQLTFSDIVLKLLDDFNSYIDNDTSMRDELNKFIFQNIYTYYIDTCPSIDTSAKFSEIKAAFESYCNRNKVSLFNRLTQSILPTLLCLSCVLDIIGYLITNNIEIIAIDQLYTINSTEESIYSNILSRHSLIKMTNYMMIPYKYTDPVKFIHLIPIIVEAYVDSTLYPEINDFGVFDELVYSCGIDNLRFNYETLAEAINQYVDSVTDFFLTKSNYEAVTNLAVSLQLHRILLDFFNSEEYRNWQLDYLKDVDSKIEYNPSKSNYIYKQNFVKLYLITRFLYDLYVNDFSFGSLTREYIMNQIESVLNEFSYMYSDSEIEREYNVFTKIILNNEFRNYIDTFIFSSLINDIVIDRLNYYLLK